MAQRVQNLRTAQTSGPMARALELSGRRWALRVVWELRVGPLSFRGLQAACGNISPSVLAGRLHELGDLGIVENIPRLGYRLTASGERLFQVLAELNKWSSGLPKDPHRRNK
jgi:DNA-binding HxlR family transcriptional regulator